MKQTFDTPESLYSYVDERSKQVKLYSDTYAMYITIRTIASIRIADRGKPFETVRQYNKRVMIDIKRQLYKLYMHPNSTKKRSAMYKKYHDAIIIPE